MKMNAAKIFLSPTSLGQKVRSVIMLILSLAGLWTLAEFPKGSLLGMAVALALLALLIWSCLTFVLSLDRDHFERLSRQARGD